MGALFGALSALSIGMSDLFNRRVAGAASVATIAITVQAVATLVAIVATIVLDAEFIVRDLALGGLGGAGMAVGLGAYYGGVTRSTATVVAPTVGTLGSVIPFLFTVATGSRPSVLAWIGAAVAIAGLAIITGGGGAVRNIRDGLAWGALSGFGYGFAASSVIGASSDSGPLPAVGQRGVALALTIAFAMRAGADLVPTASVRRTAIIGGSMSGLASVFFLVAVTFDATTAVVNQSMFPAFAVLIGWLVFSDAVSRRQLVGLAAAITGVAAVALG